MTFARGAVSAPRLFSALLLALAAFTLSIGTAMAEEIKNKRTIELSATGSASARPDMAIISTGVVTDGKTARSALDNNSAAMVRIVAALKKQGLAPKDIQTSNFSVHPRYQHFKNGRPPEIIGYQVTNSVSIKVRDIKRLGDILDEVVTLGSNNIGGISFHISKTGDLKDEATRDAMKNAIHKGNILAKSVGGKLGKVLKIREETMSVSPQPQFARLAKAQSASVPIETGEKSIKVRVHIIWELE